MSISPSAAAIPGALVISLDFEINWGVRDQQTLAQYGANLLGVRQAIPAMLALFAEFGLHVTWATVGLLFFETKAEMLAHLPAVRPEYADPNLSPYLVLDQVGEDEAHDPYHFGRSLINQIRATPGQEMASHTFCHYYCLERGQTVESFRHDIETAVRVGAEQGMALRSLVFPRNQYNAQYLETCRAAGISSYRGNEQSWIYKERSEEQQALYKRGARLLDAYVNLSGQHTARWADMARSFPYNVPASRFLRPWSGRLKALEGLRLRRILAGMEHAAKHGEVFHLWWHPHNFGVNLAENMAVLRRIAQHFRRLQARYGFESLSMGEVADRLSSYSNSPAA
ncbi:polysaccharide deacetylase family protein [Hymenobacter armeniacus]|uniref:Polysaccharide deacetylase family protein n=1 Tax=Hymenobacter armeniacus TaxID=2771358 RepID=A0ABR8JSQ6_9BACT|nr:polysaccharide deacetylase family protein [Hymenobacter armeniacus]MBD2721803.1 polysaccharide deacetylase family protein [Hymenobacter armeniacus]